MSVFDVFDVSFGQFLMSVFEVSVMALAAAAFLVVVATGTYHSIPIIHAINTHSHILIYTHTNKCGQIL